MRLALRDLFKARWTDKIHEEWINALLRTGKHSKEALEATHDLMDAHIRDAKVTGYEGLIASLELPDEDDRHVLAAAIRANADAIVTFNQKDFPRDILDAYDLDVIHPDDFIFYQIDMAPAICCQAIKAQRTALKNPAINVEDFLNILQRQQLPQTVSKLREFKEFL
jgi:predicted nucleic acid-binding protein